MVERPFHHGNLRSELLDHAETVLAEGGVEALSLRDLARRSGVSHGAPRSHFVDRQALLDALAVRGFERLAALVRAAAAEGGTFEGRVRRVARAYLDFAVQQPALMELMFAAKGEARSVAVGDAAGRLFATFDEVLEADRPDVASDAAARQRFGLLFATVVQGAASLVGSGRISPGTAAELVEDGTGILVAALLGPS
ncbi:TetR/AcrR family transcriptional regulator [Microlunatus flavus]|uniref:DNA-binding transcriptional regulator, AcrR family n=1 Tax=Microlunatus flavus TaxID=1036181 RepID=A0A1H9IZS2_9ACTN|nr:TetR/AcrR family transcriptional regulator [Microlunatus flavus]SEQ80018.1 DNA-binding transcriptional regulator, AcrR family [Microlunatus flavus]